MTESVLIVGLNWLGDNIMAMPAVQAYRRAYPSRRLTMLVKPKCRDIWTLHPVIDEVLTCDEAPAATARAIADLRKRGFEVAFILPNSFRSALVPFLAGISKRIGMPGHYRDWMLTDVIKPELAPGRVHQVYEYLGLLGMPDSAAEPARLAIPAALAERVSVSLKGTSKLKVALMPGAAYGPSKRWPAERFAETGRMLNVRFGCSILVLGSPSERSICAYVTESVGEAAIDLSGKTSVLELAAILAQCAAVLGNDSGGIHLAAAVGAPAVAVFGITDPGRTGPMGERTRVLQDSEVKARDLKRESEQATESLRRVTAEQAFEAVRGIMEKED